MNNKKSKNIKVSIIIPVFNSERYLPRLLNSLSSQRFKDFEVIFIDDCSKDESVAIIKNYKSKNSNVKFFSNDVNKGVSYSRNIGIKNSSGDFITFIDSDDYVNSDFLSFFFNKDINNNSCFSSAYINFNLNSYYVLDWLLQHSENTKFLDLPTVIGGRFFPRSIITNKNIRFLEGVRFEDEEFKFRFSYFNSNPYCKLISSSIYYYRQHDNSFTSNQMTRHSDLAIIINELTTLVKNEKDCFFKERILDMITCWIFNLKYLPDEHQTAFIISIKNSLNIIDSNSKTLIRKNDNILNVIREYSPEMILKKILEHPTPKNKIPPQEKSIKIIKLKLKLIAKIKTVFLRLSIGS